MDRLGEAIPMSTIPTISLRDGSSLPAFGLGTWQMGERHSSFNAEVAALQSGLDLGISLIDTAEMYGNGGAERVVAEAVRGRRDSVYLVSKVLPSNAGRQQVVRACENSLKRLKTDYIDLYLLHWRGSTPLEETVRAFEDLKSASKIRRWGVSNFDVEDMEELEGLTSACATNQVLYNLSRRGIEFDLLAYCQRRAIAVMAYSPVEQGQLLRDSTLASIAESRGIAPAQIALAWLLTRPNVAVIPKTSRPERVKGNLEAIGITLSETELSMLDQAFPRPERKNPLEML